MKKFTNETIFEILTYLEVMISSIQPAESIVFQIPNPDKGRQHYSDSLLDINGLPCLHHSWKAWGDLAEILYCRMLTPRLTNENEVILYFQKLDRSDSFHRVKLQDKREKYGTDSHFSTIRKNEEPAFLFAYLQALRQVKILDRCSILDLGINSGDEFDLIKTIVDESNYRQMKLIGIDHSPSAIKKAEVLFPEENVTFYCHDINHLQALELPRADLIISIGTLQSPNINFKPLFMSLIQNHLTPNGAVILGFPNCRWIDGEMIYGAKAPNYNFSEMSLVIKDIYFCKKYLQQHKFRVTITGKDYLFLTATKIGGQ